ncbi:MAG TPA: hypothetical protein VJY34_15505 [Roseiarcus sp.]|nr:hypothetical protein [Roseiarcus sp.]
MRAINPLTSARRLSLAALLIVFIAATSEAQQVDDADALRGLAQAEKDAGRVSHFNIVEVYRAIFVTAPPSATRATREVEAEIAQSWAQEFCARASRELHWERRWKLIVYAHGQAQRSYSCVIPLSQDAFKGSVPARNSECPATLEDDGHPLPESADGIE